jgi:hypothetical protein
VWRPNRTAGAAGASAGLDATLRSCEPFYAPERKGANTPGPGRVWVRRSSNPMAPRAAGHAPGARRQRFAATSGSVRPLRCCCPPNVAQSILLSQQYERAREQGAAARSPARCVIVPTRPSDPRRVRSVFGLMSTHPSRSQILRPIRRRVHVQTQSIAGDAQEQQRVVRLPISRHYPRISVSSPGKAYWAVSSALVVRRVEIHSGS